MIDRMIGSSSAFREAIRLAGRFGATQIPVLLVGETGTGKELLARYIHTRSARSGAFVDLNCGAVPREMVETVLFGHRRGAFTGAIDDGPGLVAEAERGTLFLDELASLPLDGQAKLLRVLETREFRRIGDVAKRRVDFRLIAAVQEDIGERIRAREFRVDLFHRVEGVRIVLPPLRNRVEDIEALAAHFAGELNRTIDDKGLAVLRRHSWPGNVRELRAVVERAAILTDGPVIDASLLSEMLDPPPESTDEFRNHLLAVCAAEEWRPDRIAAALQMSRATLYRRLKDCGIQLRISAKSQNVLRRLETK